MEVKKYANITKELKLERINHVSSHSELCIAFTYKVSSSKVNFTLFK